MAPEPVFLAGPTAVGKSEVALLLAVHWNAEIVSADSMQVYRGMDIGTAKPTPEERGRVPHHLIDVVDVRTPFHVAAWRDLALRAIAEIRGRGRRPLVVGGSGLYLRALTEGLFAGPGADASLRARLEALPAAELFARLQEVDPLSAQRIGPHNQRRLVRALEVFELSGRPLSALQQQWRGGGPPLLCMERPRAELYERIERRVDRMFERGLVAETERLLGQGLAENPCARVAAGYREVIAHLRGELSLSEAVRLTKQRTRQLAKRQLTWFRYQTSVVRVPARSTVEQTKEWIVRLVENARG